MAKFEPPEDEEERRAWIKRQNAKRVRAFEFNLSRIWQYKALVMVSPYPDHFTFE